MSAASDELYPDELLDEILSFLTSPMPLSIAKDALAELGVQSTNVRDFVRETLYRTALQFEHEVKDKSATGFGTPAKKSRAFYQISVVSHKLLNVLKAEEGSLVTEANKQLYQGGLLAQAKLAHPDKVALDYLAETVRRIREVRTWSEELERRLEIRKAHKRDHETRLRSGEVGKSIYESFPPRQHFMRSMSELWVIHLQQGPIRLPQKREDDVWNTEFADFVITAMRPLSSGYRRDDEGKSYDVFRQDGKKCLSGLLLQEQLAKLFPDQFL